MGVNLLIFFFFLRDSPTTLQFCIWEWLRLKYGKSTEGHLACDHQVLSLLDSWSASMCSPPISVAADMVAFGLSLHILSRVNVRLIWGQGAGASPLIFCLLLR